MEGAKNKKLWNTVKKKFRVDRGTRERGRKKAKRTELRVIYTKSDV